MNNKLLVCAVFFVGFAYLLYIPYPEDCDYPTPAKIFYSIASLAFSLSGFVERFGVGYWTIMKSLNTGQMTLADDVKVSWWNFSGVNVYFFKPEGFGKDGPGEAMLYFHGGGWTIGSVEIYSPLLLALARKTGMLVVAPKYRLAPEHPFPAAYDDCMQATEELLERAAEFNVNPNKIMLNGDSAGGNIAMAVTLALNNGASKKSNLTNVCMLSMINPMLQTSDFQLPSYLQNPNPPMLPALAVIRFYLSYIGLSNETALIEPMLNNEHMKGAGKVLENKINENLVPKKYKKRPYTAKRTDQFTQQQKESLDKYKAKLKSLATNMRISPLSASDSRLIKMPYTHIMTCEYDVLRDDGIILHERMKSLGMKVSLQNLEFGSHVLITMYGSVTYPKLDAEVDTAVQKLKDHMKQC